MAVTSIPVALIDPDPGQPRMIFAADEMAALVASIRAEGLLSPITVREVNDRYMVVAGERRFRAVQQLGWNEVPATVLSRDNLADVLVVQLVENMARADLHPIEEAHAFRRLIDAGMAATVVAERIGKSKSYVSHKLSLLTLADPLSIYLDAGLLSEGQVRQLLRLKSFYGTATTGKQDLPADVEDADRWPDEVVIPAAVLSMRPLDWPVGYHLPEFKGPAAEAIARSARALVGNAIAGDVRTWVFVAWFYATMLVSFGEVGTVSVAKTLIDHHLEHVASAMVAVFTYGTDADKWPVHHREAGWLYLSDLRHAGFATDLDTVRAWIGEHLELVQPLIAEDGPGFLAPSSRQPGAPEWVGRSMASA